MPRFRETVARLPLSHSFSPIHLRACKHCMYSPQTLSQPSTRQGYSSFIFALVPRTWSREIQVAMTLLPRHTNRSHQLITQTSGVSRLSLRNDVANRAGTHSSARAEDATSDDRGFSFARLSLFSSHVRDTLVTREYTRFREMHENVISNVPRGEVDDSDEPRDTERDQTLSAGPINKRRTKGQTKERTYDRDLRTHGRKAHLRARRREAHTTASKFELRAAAGPRPRRRTVSVARALAHSLSLSNLCPSPSLPATHPRRPLSLAPFALVVRWSVALAAALAVSTLACASSRVIAGRCHSRKSDASISIPALHRTTASPARAPLAETYRAARRDGTAIETVCAQPGLRNTVIR